MKGKKKLCVYHEYDYDTWTVNYSEIISKRFFDVQWFFWFTALMKRFFPVIALEFHSNWFLVAFTRLYVYILRPLCPSIGQT